MRELYQGVLQIGVGCYHLTVRSNFIGATRKLDEGARRLERAGVAGGKAYGVDWTALIADADRLRGRLWTLGSDRVADFDRAWLPRVAFTSPHNRRTA